MSSPAPPPPRPASGPRPWGWLALGAGLYLALLLGLLLPATDGLTAALGMPSRDLFDHLWLHDWMSASLADGGSLLSSADIAWPDGGRLMHPDPLGWLLHAALAPCAGLVGAYDLMLVLQLWFGALAAWLLGSRVSGSGWAGWLAGLAFGLSPFLLGQALGGESETAAAWPLVLAIWALERAADDRRWQAGLLAGALGALTAIASWYYGAFFALYAVVWALLRRRARVASVALGSFVGLVAGPALVYGGMLGASDNLFQGPSLATYIAQHPATLAGMVGDPAGWLGFFPGLLERAGHPRTMYLGTVTLLLAGAGAVLPGSRRRLWWAGLALVALLLSLGPVLHFGGQPVTVAGHALPGPLAVIAWLPLVGLMRIPHRLTLLAALGLALLAARGVRVLAGDDQPPPAAAPRWLPRLPLLVVLASVLLLLDLGLFADLPGRGAGIPAVSGLHEPPPVHTRLPGSGAVLDLPPRMLEDDARGRYLVWQRHHGRPVPYSLLMTGISEPLATEPLVAAIAALDSRDPIAHRPDHAAQFRRRDLALAARAFRDGRSGGGELQGARERLLDQGIDAVVLHTALMAPADAEKAVTLLVAWLGVPAVETEAALAWDLGGGA